VGGSSAYSFLLAMDELVELGESLIREIERELPGRAGVAALHESALLVERSRALRDEARRMALVPSSELFSGMTELARRMANEQGKSLRVIHHVASDLLEREMVLVLRPALLHLVGNAVTHGVQARAGVLELGYQRAPAELLVRVRDNGRGLSQEGLRAAVIRDGHMSEQEWDSLPEPQRLQWIFHPGLSTRSEVDVSAGRGMGLAVVAETAVRLGGRVEVASSAEGTEFRLHIPSDWNLRQVLRVRSEGRDFAVLSGELAAVEAFALQDVARSVYLGELCSLLGYPGAARTGAYRLLIDKGLPRKLAFGVDAVGEFDEVLVTPLSDYDGLPAAMVGVTPHDGAALAVISLLALCEGAAPRRSSEPERTGPVEGPLLLVVDDSLTTRTLVTGILGTAGYRVIVAADGQQGLELATTPGLAGIISDYQMPIMDGLDFLARLRQDPQTAGIPFVLLTSIDDLATFEKASGLGADRCLGKQNFSQDLLLRTIGELL
jgi:two-component system chemotaxis sensor kinase CheA